MIIIANPFQVGCSVPRLACCLIFRDDVPWRVTKAIFNWQKV